MKGSIRLVDAFGRPVNSLQEAVVNNEVQQLRDELASLKALILAQAQGQAAQPIQTQAQVTLVRTIQVKAPVTPETTLIRKLRNGTNYVIDHTVPKLENAEVYVRTQGVEKLEDATAYTFEKATTVADYAGAKCNTLAGKLRAAAEARRQARLS